MDKFWSLVAESVITQSVITAAVIGTDCALVLMARPIPQEMWTLTMLVGGFWFGSKVGYTQANNKAAAAAAVTAGSGAHDG
jgi:uncharacterized membrane protein